MRYEIIYTSTEDYEYLTQAFWHIIRSEFNICLVQSKLREIFYFPMYESYTVALISLSTCTESPMRDSMRRSRLLCKCMNIVKSLQLQLFVVKHKYAHINDYEQSNVIMTF